VTPGDALVFTRLPPGVTRTSLVDGEPSSLDNDAFAKEYWPPVDALVFYVVLSWASPSP